MDFRIIRAELKKMSKSDLFRLLGNQKISRCVIKDGVCPFLFNYKGFNFCISELLGEGCQDERIKKLQEINKIGERFWFSLPLKFKEIGKAEEFQKEGIEFKVFYRNSISSAIIFLGKIIERRRKERGNNLKDLLNKAKKDFSNKVEDPFSIFLLA